MIRPIQRVDVSGPQFHQDVVEVNQLAPQEHYSQRIVEQIVDVPSPQFHGDIAGISCTVTSRSGSSRKSARLSPNGPEVFEFETGRGSSLQPLPHRQRRRLRTSGVEVKGYVSPLRKSARRFP